MMTKKTVISRYTGLEFDIDLEEIDVGGGRVITNITHECLERIIFNEIPEEYGVKVSVPEPLVNTNVSHPVILRTISDNKGRCIRKLGEASPDTLTTKIAKDYPVTMADTRAFDRAALAYLNFDLGDAHVYSSSEGIEGSNKNSTPSSSEFDAIMSELASERINEEAKNTASAPAPAPAPVPEVKTQAPAPVSVQTPVTEPAPIPAPAPEPVIVPEPTPMPEPQPQSTGIDATADFMAFLNAANAAAQASTPAQTPAPAPVASAPVETQASATAPNPVTAPVSNSITDAGNVIVNFGKYANNPKSVSFLVENDPTWVSYMLANYSSDNADKMAQMKALRKYNDAVKGGQS